LTTTIRKIGGSSRFSAIAIHNGVAHLAGQVSQLADGDIVAQANDTFAKVEALLAEAGSGKERLLSVQLWLADMADYDAMNAAWDAWIADVAPPVRVCVEAHMAKPHYKIEIMAIAALK
jgi:enamine deaminase RidA (YjgF/YER057c/UK114 family)